MTLKIFGIKVRFLNTRRWCNFGNHTRTYQLVVPVTLQPPFWVQQKPYGEREVRVGTVVMSESVFSSSTNYKSIINY